MVDSCARAKGLLEAENTGMLEPLELSVCKGEWRNYDTIRRDLGADTDTLYMIVARPDIGMKLCLSLSGLNWHKVCLSLPGLNYHVKINACPYQVLHGKIMPVSTRT